MLGGLDIYLVGGAVRDELLGLSVTDRDWVVVGATVDDMLGRGFRQVGKDFPVFLHPETHEEYALARTERKTGQGHTAFAVHADPSVTLPEDLARRDLTINAIAKAQDGTLIDPFGGVADLGNTRLRHVSEAFTEDPLRILRVARFAARLPQFHVVDATLELMRRMTSSGELDSLSAERVWGETEGALGAVQPNRFFDVLGDAGALTPWFDEIERWPEAFAAGGALDRFTELWTSEASLDRFAERLRLPNRFRGAAKDRLRWGDELRRWTSVDAEVLVDAMQTLGVQHDVSRLTATAARVAAPQQDRLARLAQAFADAKPAADTAPGPEYGAALREARVAALAAFIDLEGR